LPLIFVSPWNILKKKSYSQVIVHFRTDIETQSDYIFNLSPPELSFSTRFPANHAHILLYLLRTLHKHLPLSIRQRHLDRLLNSSATKHSRQTDTRSQTLDPMTQRPNEALIKQDGLADGGDDGSDAERGSAFGGDDGVSFGLGGVCNVGEGWGSGGEEGLDVTACEVGGGPCYLKNSCY
jgi:hypothetical protein